MESQDCNMFYCPDVGDYCPYNYALTTSDVHPIYSGFYFPSNNPCTMAVGDRFAPPSGMNLVTVTSPLGTYPKYNVRIQSLSVIVAMVIDIQIIFFVLYSSTFWTRRI